MSREMMIITGLVIVSFIVIGLGIKNSIDEIMEEVDQKVDDIPYLGCYKIEYKDNNEDDTYYGMDNHNTNLCILNEVYAAFKNRDNDMSAEEVVKYMYGEEKADRLIATVNELRVTTKIDEVEHYKEMFKWLDNKR